eukprot:gnl/Chilomastix_caulleri/6981.p3 GENE.gnl/Chilomastix_caulleri/6981~~gnl/Chilomastix_caulleri/6981.p3  ORF type:complete len:52 (-),score=12.99 gnl/Chilomastix_caulleri/6981:238-393(-)
MLGRLVEAFKENVERNNDVARAESYSFNAKFSLLYYEEQFDRIPDFKEFRK